jgi:hypothetical protein
MGGGWHEMTIFNLQRVEHALGPGRRVYSNAITENDYRRRYPLELSPGMQRPSGSALRHSAARYTFRQPVPGASDFD